jgi:hypothetical protein
MSTSMAACCSADCHNPEPQGMSNFPIVVAGEGITLT